MLPVRIGFVAEIAQAILHVVSEALAETTLGRPGLLTVGHANPPDDCCDYANVVFSGFRASTPAGTIAPPTTDRCVNVAFAAEFAVTVARNAPQDMQATRRAPFPDPVVERNATEALLEDAVALMYYALPSVGWAVRNLVPFDWLAPPVYQPGRLTPFSQGGCAGWVAQGALSLPQPPPL